MGRNSIDPHYGQQQLIALGIIAADARAPHMATLVRRRNPVVSGSTSLGNGEHAFRTNTPSIREGDPHYNRRSKPQAGDFYTVSKVHPDPGHHINLYLNRKSTQSIRQQFMGMLRIPTSWRHHKAISIPRGRLNVEPDARNVDVPPTTSVSTQRTFDGRNDRLLMMR
jgi:hypothetical protein